MKKIRISVKNIEKLEFELMEKAEPNDYICLNDINYINFNSLITDLNTKRNKILAPYLKTVEEDISKAAVNTFKANDAAYQMLKADQQHFINLKEKLQDKIYLETQKSTESYSKEIAKLKETIAALNQYKTDDYKQNIINKYLANSKEYHNLLSASTELANLKINLNEKVENATNSLKLNKQNEINLLQQEIKNLQFFQSKNYADNIISNYLNTPDFEQKIYDRSKLLFEENKELKSQLQGNKNSATIGANLTNYLYGQLNLVYGNSGNVKIIKEPKPISGTKPDILVNFYDDKNQALISTIVIEAKSQSSTGKVKNFTFFNKLSVDLNKFGLAKNNFAILVTEVEPKEDFEIRTIKGHSNMYMVRPFALISVVTFMQNLVRKYTEIENVSIDLKAKQELYADFENYRTKVFSSIIKKYEKGEADNQKYLEQLKIIHSKMQIIHDSIFKNYINEVIKKIEDFKISKYIKKLK